MKNPSSTSPYTIGYLASHMGESSGRLLWQAIKERAQSAGVNLVTFAGAQLRYPQPFYHHANQVYELVDRTHLDGLILWTSSLAGAIGQEEIRKFCQQYAPLPMVGIGTPIPGIPSLILDSYNGMRAALLHLIQEHGKRQILFIRGPEHHRDAQERLNAYRDVVAEYGLDDNPALVSPPCRWTEQDAWQVLRHMVEEEHVSFDAIAGANDELAYGAILYLREIGKRLPEDVAIIGFDNSQIGKVCTPPLTTVPNRIRERGRRAVEMLLAKLAGEPVPEIVTLPTSVKIRQSCGCQDPYIVQANKPPALLAGAEQASHSNPSAHIVSLLKQTAPAEYLAADWAETLYDAFQESLDRADNAPFLKKLQRILLSSSASGSELREWQAALSELRHWAVSHEQRRPERLEMADRLIHQGRVMIGEIAARSQAYQEWLRSNQLNDLLRLRQALSAIETRADLMDILARELPHLKIASACLALYVDSAHPLDGAQVALAFNESGRLRDTEGQTFTPSTRLVPPPFLDLARPFSLVIHPLFFGTEQLGFFVMDSSTFESSDHQVLREQISSALKNVLLIEQNIQLYLQARKNQQLAEEANLLKSRFLSMVSHELLTPIVLLVGLSEMMLHEGGGNRPPLPEAYRQDLTRIHAGAQQLGSLVRDVLDLTRSQLGKLTLSKKPMHLEEMLKPVLLVSEQMAHSKGLAWLTDIPARLPLVLGDASRLQQVTLNLISNAIKFTTQGSVRLSISVNPGSVTLSVTDTGLSVPLAEQEAIFDEFRQSERTVARGYGGLGIGLAICKQIIELHNGQIGVHSTGEENSGSTFYYTLPTLSEPTITPSPQPTETVLILTEHIEHSLPLCQHLERQGFRVQTVDTTQYRHWLDDLPASPPGAVVLDFPAAERCWEIMEIIKENPVTQDLPVVFYSLLDGEQRGASLSFDYLTKPVAAAKLAEALQRYGIDHKNCPERNSILIVDDDHEILALHTRLVEQHLPSCRTLQANNGRVALEWMRADPPALVLLDLMMPEMDGMAVLKAMQEDKHLQNIPVIILTAQQLSDDEMARLNQGVAAVLSKGIFTTEETLHHIEQTLARHKRLGSENQRLARKAMAYIHENYAQSISRQELAACIGVSERHLNRCFMQETGMTPLTYLNRYRIQQAKKLLEQGCYSITEIIGKVGFSDSSHFTRLFRREVGVSPSAYKKGQRP